VPQTKEIASLLIHGKCHCGNISFSLTWEPDPAVAALIAAVEDPADGVRFAGVPEIRDAGRRFHLR